MTPSHVVSQTPFWFPLITAGVGIFASIVGVYGALSVQRYIVTANAVREKYKTLRETYACFASTLHTYITVSRSLVKNHVAHKTISDEKKKQLDRSTNRDATTEDRYAHLVKINSILEKDIDHIHKMHLILNEQENEAIVEIHRTHAIIVMLERNPSRRETFKSYYNKCRNAFVTIKAALDQPNGENIDAVNNDMIGGIDEWIAATSVQIAEEERVELANIPYFQS